MAVHGLRYHLQGDKQLDFRPGDLIFHSFDLFSNIPPCLSAYLCPYQFLAAEAQDWVLINKTKDKLTNSNVFEFDVLRSLACGH